MNNVPVKLSKLPHMQPSETLTYITFIKDLASTEGFFLFILIILGDIASLSIINRY